MARRRLIWHIGLADAPRDVVGTNLEAHRELLTAAGVQVVASPDEARLATREVLGTDRGAGVWAELCERVWRHKGTSLLSTPGICVADKDHLRFALDQLVDVEVHLVLTVDAEPVQLYGGWLAQLRAGRTTSWDTYVGRVLADPPAHAQAERFRAGHDVDAIVARWGWTLREERVHVLTGTDPAEQWAALLGIAGLAERPASVVPSYDDVSTAALSVETLAEALTENAQLREELDVLRAAHARLDRKRRKLKRRLKDARKN